MQQVTLADFESRALPTLLEFAKIPCLSPMFDAQWHEHGHLDDAVELLADWARQRALKDFDVTVRRIEGRTPMLVVTVGATADVEGTVVLYGHLDKQPPLGNWSPGLAPFEPVRRGDRLYARGVVDDGYSVFSALLALEAMESQGIAHSRCIVLIEASEESGSEDLDYYLDELHDHLDSPELIICLDAGGFSYDRLWVTTSLRGVLNVEVRVDVLERGQHSGAASGVVPSSFRILRQLLDRIEDSSTGEIRLPELFAPIPEEHVAAAKVIEYEFGDIVANGMPAIEGLELMGNGASDRLLRRTWFPTLSVIGIGGVPEPSIAGNVLRPWTSAVISLRLPPTIDSRLAQEVVTKAFTENVPAGARVTLSSWNLGDGWLAPPLTPWLREALTRASYDAFGHDPGYVGEGGSIPFLAALGRRFPNVQFVATGALGPNANAHGIDEMLELPMAVGITNAVITVVDAYTTQKGLSS